MPRAGEIAVGFNGDLLLIIIRYILWRSGHSAAKGEVFTRNKYVRWVMSGTDTGAKIGGMQSPCRKTDSTHPVQRRARTVDVSIDTKMSLSEF